MKPIIDISYFQRPELIDYDTLAAQIDGAILRAGYGTGAPGKFEGADPAFETHYAELHKRGVPLGAYHYITEYQPIDEQARLFIDTVKGKDLPLGYWCDVEIEPNATKLTANSVIRYMELVEAELGELGIYTGFYYWRDVMGSEAGRYATRKLWLSAYHIESPTNYIPPAWNGRYYYWQYTDSGRLDGYGRDLDLNKRGTQMTDILLNIQPLSQKDPRWSALKLGTSTSTIGGYGCLITSASMMLKHFGFDTDPARLNTWLINNGGYYNGNLFVWASLEKYDPRIDYQYRYKPVQLDKVDAQLAKGFPVIVNVDLVPSTTVLDEHWVLVVGKVNGSYIINDPWYGTQFKFEEKYGAPSTGMRIACTYNFNGVVVPPEPPTPIEVGKVVKTLVRVNMRKSPNRYISNVWQVLPIGERLDVIETRIVSGERWIRCGWNQWVMVELNGVKYLEV